MINIKKRKEMNNKKKKTTTKISNKIKNKKNKGRINFGFYNVIK